MLNLSETRIRNMVLKNTKYKLPIPNRNLNEILAFVFLIYVFLSSLALLASAFLQPNNLWFGYGKSIMLVGVGSPLLYGAYYATAILQEQYNFNKVKQRVKPNQPRPLLRNIQASNNCCTQLSQKTKDIFFSKKHQVNTRTSSFIQSRDELKDLHNRRINL